MLTRLFAVVVLACVSVSAFADGLDYKISFGPRLQVTSSSLSVTQVSSSEFVIYFNQAGTRVPPLPLKVQSAVDRRPVDGELIVTFQGGYELIVTPGDMQPVKYFLRNPSGKETELVLEGRLESILSGPCASGVSDAKENRCVFPDSIVPVSDGVKARVEFYGTVLGGVDSNSFYLTQESRSEFTLQHVNSAARIAPIYLKVISVSDRRPVDGEMVVTFDRGYKLVVTPGDRTPVKYLLERPNGSQVDLTLKPRLEAVKGYSEK